MGHTTDTPASPHRGSVIIIYCTLFPPGLALSHRPLLDSLTPYVVKMRIATSYKAYYVNFDGEIENAAKPRNGLIHKGISMPRPRLGAEPYEKLTVRIDKGTMQDIQQYMQRLQAQAMGLRVDLGGTARRLLLYGLQYAKDLERHEATQSGPVLAPVPLGADQTADHTDHSDQKAAPIQDQQRTTARPGRKRPTAAKG